MMTVKGLSVVSGKSYVSASFNDDTFHTEIDDYGNESEVYDEYVKIEHVYVHPSERGKGLAKEMLRLAVKTAQELHPSATIYLAALPEDDKPLDQAALVALYEKCGFRATKEQGSEAVVMEYRK